MKKNKEFLFKLEILLERAHAMNINPLPHLRKIGGNWRVYYSGPYNYEQDKRCISAGYMGDIPAGEVRIIPHCKNWFSVVLGS